MPAPTANAPHEKRTYVEKRRKKDWVTRAIPILSAIGWVATLVMITLLERAQPEQGNMFTAIFGAPLRSYWNTSLLLAALLVLIAVVFISVVGFFFNMKRHRRKSDKYNKPLIALGCVSIISLVLFLVRFGSFL